MMRRAIYSTVLCLCGIHAFGQKDTLPKYTTQYIEIKEAVLDETGNLPAIDGVRIYGGKKTAFVTPEKLNIDLSSNNSRQLFGRIPGIMVWESDGSGIQTMSKAAVDIENIWQKYVLQGSGSFDSNRVSNEGQYSMDSEEDDDNTLTASELGYSKKKAQKALSADKLKLWKKAQKTTKRNGDNDDLGE